jgi:hypothetical protein
MPETKNKPPFPFDHDAFDLVNRAAADPDAAAALLLLAADYMRRGKQLPCSLADFLAEAIETAMNTPTIHDPQRGDKGRALLVALHLKANNRRPSPVEPREVYYFMKQAMEGLGGKEFFKNAHLRRVSQNKAAELAAKQFGIKAPTAKKLFKAYKEKPEGRRFGPQEREFFTNYLRKLRIQLGWPAE